ncbi:MAG: carboxymuconolactone decarboxylase family protein [Alphaproteobacteria bacterium]|jgi:4-carboxymuconolactone decarboxylase|nr:carboxymuconolactone decarboxylase family protein [Alphaproteobacteria bacterium]MDP6237430.1 carboxymuconolactone decarboxylase family protein [Alphaproteobacteria bacterium]MDP7172525.1 carboxymuconolactone decarboxylase family protein [Alphaproteobacteria bacterium]MDP7234216.1 carboxymuconolactone decarboxylase family protein [Alphaproteobacteria bacterium]MDP7488719.1 carboxymuconolactone decarboxylase family protein [Alphaproteobacteria bacterium]|tara:strand:+ start:2735 stop:3289 length:555 start_codon:yes stop_codon:yes gene_type:complete
MPRLPTLSLDGMTDAQRAVYDTISTGPRGSGARGPFNAWLQSPDFANRAQHLGVFLRFGASFSARLKELAILTVARHWTAQFEWYAHKKLAIDNGLTIDVINAVETRNRPDFVNDDEAAVYDFSVELHATHGISDDTYANAEKHLGAAGVVELVGLLGYYTLVSMTLNVFEVPLPEGEPLPLNP